ncbi:MAG: AMP-binding protein [Bacteroidetes bacterium]|nr:AMP-binding protein [Bacteroidota bacterium]
MIPLNIRDAVKLSSLHHSARPALSFVDGEPFTYGKMLEEIIRLSLLLKKSGIQKGDKVAILSRNCPQWGISYLATVFTGAVVVPILPDFNKVEVSNILRHSEAKLVFVSDSLVQNVDFENIAGLDFLYDIFSFSLINSKDKSWKQPESEKDFTVNSGLDLELILGNVHEDDLAAIIYTSGTTGSSKGVMLSHKNIMSNVIASSYVQMLYPEDRLLSLLPLSHTYECTIGFMLPLTHGSAIYYLDGPPVAGVLVPALQKIRPTIILSVPLIIEKIYRAKIAPKFKKGIMKNLVKVALLRKLFYRIAGRKLMKTFGGKLHFFGIGGALLDAEVEKFLFEARFPYAIGYGLTETAPLLAGADPKETRYRSTGKALVGQQLKLGNINPETGIGEILAKGDNVMMGYYKDEAMTRKSFTEDGWFRTGDLAYVDEKGYFFIRGRSKNVILGSSGENIYPEDIESVINRHHLVLESVVYELKGKLVAKIHLNYEEVENTYNKLKLSAQTMQQDVKSYIQDVLEEIKRNVNSEVNKLSRLNLVIEQPIPFDKTPTMKIKKYLYTS